MFVFAFLYVLCYVLLNVDLGDCLTIYDIVTDYIHSLCRTEWKTTNSVSSRKHLRQVCT